MAHPIELETELRVALGGFGLEARTYFERQRIRGYIPDCICPVGHIRVRLCRGGLYEPVEVDEPGHWAFVVPVRVLVMATAVRDVLTALPVPIRAGDEVVVEKLIDLCAWLPGQESKTYLRIGGAEVLGAAEITRHQWTDKPLHVHQTPLEWVRNKGHGCVVLYWPAVRMLLGSVTMISVSSVAFRERIEKAMQPPKQLDVRLLPKTVAA